jgi:Spy/CpxP family protein refolding chaperone
VQALDLSDDQKTLFEALRSTFRADAEALRESGEALATLRESHRDQFHALLTDEQKVQLEALHAEREANRSEGRHGGGGHGRMGP